MSQPVRTADSGDLAMLRQAALAAVNRSRAQHGLSPLRLTDDLNEAAQNHAGHMFRNDYYSHVSPQGEDVQDRYVKAGGSRWELVAENIARCEGCRPPPTKATVQRLQAGWMDSPGHRANILREGLTGFGFGIVVDESRGLYAVQTFAGPGTPRGLKAGETAQPIPPAQQARVALAHINAARKEAGVPPLAIADTLNRAAQAMLPPPDDLAQFDLQDDLFDALPEDARARWRRLSAVAGACGGCGAEPTAADVRAFVAQWLDDAQHRRSLTDSRFSHLGFALVANGAGKKVALAVLGAQR